MKYLIFVFLIIFSNLSLADRCYDKVVRNTVNDRYLTEGTRYVDMTICTYLVDGESEGDSPVLIFAIKLNEADHVKFKHRVRVMASGAASNPCIIGRRGEYSSAINYNPTESECDSSNNFVSMRFNFRSDDSDSSKKPMLIIFNMDVSQATNDRFVDLKIGNEIILDQVLYFEYEPAKIENAPDSCGIEVYGSTGGMIFNDTNDISSKYLDARLYSKGGSFKLIHNSNNHKLKENFLGYYGLYYDYNRDTFIDTRWVMKDDDHRLVGKNYIRVAPKYDINRSELSSGEYITTLEIVCE
ncbi:hypothetical protein GTG28_14175 [Vibrio sp. OCN044]|uniref:Uncharacterized protein n=1 Tax=Vibrio tetraodonis subsp. pristinus TaxID=2695891 RepID=A0A6L8LW76_9VIBR|nr:hypothetical protein [Vibrio tetraodonis]MYM60377.1 hypothetical protein [Vibrio tetraodonis subsp. pristinus]